MDNVDKFFRESHYNIVRLLLSLSGLWPFQSKASCYAIYCGLLLVIGSCITFQVLGVIEFRNDPEVTIQFTTLAIYFMLVIIKAICVACTLSKVKIVLMKIKEHWISPKTDEEAAILYSYASYGQKFGYVYTVVLLGYSILYLSESLLEKFTYVESNGTSKTSSAQVGLPFRVNYMVDVDTYYVPIFLHIVMCEISYVTILCAVDILYLTSVQYYCGLIAALRYILENACNLKDFDGLLKNVTKNGKSYSIVAYSIQRHTEAIQFIDILESLYRLPLLIHTGCIMLTISIVGFQMITNADDMNRASQHFTYLSVALLNTFFENWQGQRIIDSNEMLYHSIYDMKWYEMPNAAKKLVILIMLRCLKPSHLTAGKIIVMSYKNFCAVIRMSSSYFMLLRSMQTV